MRQEWDPLYTGLGLGGFRNVTIVANPQGLSAAKARMNELLLSTPPEVPDVWREFATALVKVGLPDDARHSLE